MFGVLLFGGQHGIGDSGWQIMSASKGPSQPVGVKSKFDNLSGTDRLVPRGMQGRMCMYDEDPRARFLVYLYGVYTCT